MDKKIKLLLELAEDEAIKGGCLTEYREAKELLLSIANILEVNIDKLQTVLTLEDLNKLKDIIK